MTAVLDSIRRIVAEDAAHGGVTHEVYLRRETVEAIATQNAPYVYPARGNPKRQILGLPLHIQNIGRDCIATLRNGAIISVINL